MLAQVFNPPKLRRTVPLLDRRALQHGEPHFSSREVGWCSPTRPKAIARHMRRQSKPVESVVPERDETWERPRVNLGYSDRYLIRVA